MLASLSAQDWPEVAHGLFAANVGAQLMHVTLAVHSCQRIASRTVASKFHATADPLAIGEPHERILSHLACALNQAS